jgi:hypothetical protein
MTSEASAEYVGGRYTSADIEDASSGGEVSVRSETKGSTKGSSADGDDETGRNATTEPADVPVSVCVESVTDAAIARQAAPAGADIVNGLQYVVRTCDYSPGSLGGAGVVVDVRPVNIPPSPYVLLDEATRNLQVPLPQEHLSPSIDVAHLVGFPEWLAVDPATFATTDATASVPGLAVTLTAIPLQSTWTFGNGDIVSCPGPGTPWTRSARDDATPPCGYTYQWSSTATRADGVYHLTVTTAWSRRWTCDPACVGGALPDLDRTSAFTLTVHQAQAVITNTPGN